MVAKVELANTSALPVQWELQKWVVCVGGGVVCGCGCVCGYVRCLCSGSCRSGCGGVGVWGCVGGVVCALPVQLKLQKWVVRVGGGGVCMGEYVWVCGG